MSRTDLVIEVPLPDRTARARILADTLTELGAVLNSGSAGVDIDDEALSDLAGELAGLSGRRLRKLVFEAVLVVAESGDPALTVDHLSLAATRSASRLRT